MFQYYYDTGVYAHFLFASDWNHQFSPTKLTAYKSVLCVEELLHGYLNGKFGVNDSFIEVYTKIQGVESFFRPYEISLKDVQTKLNYIMGSLSQNNIDLKGDLMSYNADSNLLLSDIITA